MYLYIYVVTWIASLHFIIWFWTCLVYVYVCHTVVDTRECVYVRVWKYGGYISWCTHDNKLGRHQLYRRWFVRLVYLIVAVSRTHWPSWHTFHYRNRSPPATYDDDLRWWPAAADPTLTKTNTPPGAHCRAYISLYSPHISTHVHTHIHVCPLQCDTQQTIIYTYIKHAQIHIIKCRKQFRLQVHKYNTIHSIKTFKVSWSIYSEGEGDKGHIYTSIAHTLLSCKEVEIEHLIQYTQ